MNMELSERVWAAHADVWQAEGRLRASLGGGALELAGVRLMASGLPYAKWNNGDVSDPQLVDLDAVRAWYAERGLPWGLRVPVGLPWEHGRRLFRKLCMGLRAGAFRPVATPAGLAVRVAGPTDGATVAAIDVEAFASGAAVSEADVAATGSWIRPKLGSRAHVVAIAALDGEPVGVGAAVLTDDLAGPCVGLFGIGVVARARRRGIGAAVSSWLVERGFETGATLAHLNPESDAAARIYARLGFVETAGLDVYVDV